MATTRRYSGTGGDLRGLSIDLANEARRVGARAALAIRKTARDIERDAKIMAPVDTGNLRNSISTEITGDGRSGSMTAIIGPTAHYGIYQELGTSRMAAQPYLFPAADRHEPGFIAAMAQAAEPRL